MKLCQCWDDGVVDDIRLIEILRRHDATASFNLNYATHPPQRTSGWKYKNKEVVRLAMPELKDVYNGFLIANHSLTHPHLEQIAPEDALREIQEGRAKLEQHFGYVITGFAYPFGTFNAQVQEMIRDTGHVYARTCHNVADAFPPEDATAFHPNCHFLAPDFWERFAHVAANDGVFYFWGHSYEIMDEDGWQNFESKIARMTAQPGAQWVDLPDLFAK